MTTVEGLGWLTSAVLDILKDGQWHKFSDFVPLASRIPPELAVRKWSVANPGSKVPKEFQVERGQNTILKVKLQQLKNVTRRLSGENGELEYRIIPSFGKLGQLKKMMSRGKKLNLVLALNENGDIIVEDIK